MFKVRALSNSDKWKKGDVFEAESELHGQCPCKETKCYHIPSIKGSPVCYRCSEPIGESNWDATCFEIVKEEPEEKSGGRIPFDPEKVKLGYPVISRSGKRCKFVHYDESEDKYPFVFLGSENDSIIRVTIKGKYYYECVESDEVHVYDMFMDSMEEVELVFINVWKRNTTGEVMTVICNSPDEVEEDKKDVRDFTFIQTLPVIINK